MQKVRPPDGPAATLETLRLARLIRRSGRLSGEDQLGADRCDRADLGSSPTEHGTCCRRIVRAYFTDRDYHQAAPSRGQTTNASDLGVAPCVVVPAPHGGAAAPIALIAAPTPHAPQATSIPSTVTDRNDVPARRPAVAGDCAAGQRWAAAQFGA
jgi:hypothetical protein